MAELSTLLLASLNPGSRKAAEHSLLEFSNSPNSLSTLLTIILDPSGDPGARLAAGTLFKNTIKRRWFEVSALILIRLERVHDGFLCE